MNQDVVYLKITYHKKNQPNMYMYVHAVVVYPNFNHSFIFYYLIVYIFNVLFEPNCAYYTCKETVISIILEIPLGQFNFAFFTGLSIFITTNLTFTTLFDHVVECFAYNYQINKCYETLFLITLQKTMITNTIIIHAMCLHCT